MSDDTDCPSGRRHDPDLTTDTFLGTGLGYVGGEPKIMAVHDVVCARCGVRYRYADYGQKEPDRFGAAVRT